MWGCVGIVPWPGEASSGKEWDMWAAWRNYALGAYDGSEVRTGKEKGQDGSAQNLVLPWSLPLNFIPKSLGSHWNPLSRGVSRCPVAIRLSGAQKRLGTDGGWRQSAGLKEPQISSDQPMPHKRGSVTVCWRMNECRGVGVGLGDVSQQQKKWDLWRGQELGSQEVWNVFRIPIMGIQELINKRWLTGVAIISLRRNAHQNRDRILLQIHRNGSSQKDEQ